MKRKYIYVISFFLVIAIFTVVFGLSYRKAKEREIARLRQTEQAKTADTTNSIRITSQTEYVLETYYGSDDRIESEQLPVPADFAGKNRQELENYIQMYVENPSLEESLQGLTGFEIISFSANRLVLRKTYQDMAKENRFFLTVENNEIIAYYNDKKTVYLNTGIMSEELSKDEQAKLVIGYYVKDEEELYSLLENYSS